MRLFSQQLRAALPSDVPQPPPLADDRLERFALVSPVYAVHLRQRPQDWAWLEDPDSLRDWHAGDFKHVWEAAHCGLPDGSPAWYDALRRLRRRMMLRLAYRDICRICPPERSLEEQTLLAEFVLGEVLNSVFKNWIQRLGRPWSDETNAPARWCVMALGKLGARELNFFSDLDLIFFFEGSGCCRKEGAAGGVANEEFFARAFREACGKLQQPSPWGPLYRVDLRLRPEGDSGPLVRRFSGLLNYYWTMGQTWERLAWIRARPVAGDLSLGGELLEELNAFRYPRSTSPALLQEVAGVKLRTEREVVGAGMLERDIKSGIGGIREIEFFVQAHQLINGGRNPFLQTGSTAAALERLARYNLIDEDTRAFLWSSYLFLREVENRIQQREEQPSHMLPPEGDPWLEALAQSLGFDSTAAFSKRLETVRARVRRIYENYFGEDTRERTLQSWTAFLGGAKPEADVAQALEQWFGNAPNRDERVRQFALGGAAHTVTREQVSLFLDVAQGFARIGKKLARPLRALERLGSFASRYGSRKQFFKACIDSPDVFEALSLVFDRSGFIHSLLCAHPEIMEELLHTSRNRNKSRADLAHEIALLPKGTEFPHMLWLYVKAEQVRLAMGQALYDWPREEVEDQLTRLADAAIDAALKTTDPDGDLAVVALGKYGGEELGFGSDLDLLVLACDENLPRAQKSVAQLCRLLGYAEPLGKIYEVDLRLRPYGKDGPLATTLQALERYHAAGGGAQTWERQILTRARAVAGSQSLLKRFFDWRDKLLYTESQPADALSELWRMRLKAQAEKTRPLPNPNGSFKASAGGLMDLEFLAQMLQLRLGAVAPQLRSPNTGEVLEAAARWLGDKEPEFLELPAYYDYLRRIEMAIRRDTNQCTSLIPDPGRQRYALARAMGFQDEQSFMENYADTLKRVRKDTLKALGSMGMPLSEESTAS